MNRSTIWLSIPATIYSNKSQIWPTTMWIKRKKRKSITMRRKKDRRRDNTIMSSLKIIYFKVDNQKWFKVCRRKNKMSFWLAIQIGNHWEITWNRMTSSASNIKPNRDRMSKGKEKEWKMPRRKSKTWQTVLWANQTNPENLLSSTFLNNSQKCMRAMVMSATALPVTSSITPRRSSYRKTSPQTATFNN